MGAPCVCPPLSRRLGPQSTSTPLSHTPRSFPIASVPGSGPLRPPLGEHTRDCPSPNSGGWSPPRTPGSARSLTAAGDTRKFPELWGCGWVRDEEIRRRIKTGVSRTLGPFPAHIAPACSLSACSSSWSSSSSSLWSLSLQSVETVWHSGAPPAEAGAGGAGRRGEQGGGLGNTFPRVEWEGEAGGPAGEGPGPGVGSRGALEPSGCLSRAPPSPSSAQSPPLAAQRSPGGRPTSHPASAQLSPGSGLPASRTESAEPRGLQPGRRRPGGGDAGGGAGNGSPPRAGLCGDGRRRRAGKAGEARPGGGGGGPRAKTRGGGGGAPKSPRGCAVAGRGRSRCRRWGQATYFL